VTAVGHGRDQAAVAPAAMSSIRPVTLDDVVGLDRYEAIRDDLRRRIIVLKRHRRVSVGDEISFVFENHDTVHFQIQEMLRAERITDLDAVREEIAVYNELLPRPGELSATMLIEITREDDIPKRLLALLGIDEAVRLEVGAEHVDAAFEPGRSREDKLSAVQYVRFPFSEAARAGFLGDLPAWLVIDHRNYRARAALDGALRDSLRADLATVQ
jgi:hypothetical protein